MNIMRSPLYGFLLYGLVLLSIIPSCGNKEKIEQVVPPTLSPYEIFVEDGEAFQQTVWLTAGTDWEIENPTSQDGWCSITPVSGKAGTTALSVEIQANDYDEREHMFIIKDDWGTTASLFVLQAVLIIEFEDENFMNYCLSQFDLNGDGGISKSEALKVQKIIVPSSGIRSLQDIEAFENLEELDCRDNDLSYIDLSKNTKLRILDCRSNQLAALDVSNNTVLEELNCRYNKLSSLDVSNNTALKNLDCGFNELAALDVSNNTALEYLDCWNNELTSLDVSSNIVLEYLDCSDNELTSLNVSKNTALEDLNCGRNQLTALDVSNNTVLKDLSCPTNQLTSLNVGNNTVLEDLYCGGNQLAILDVSKNTVLKELSCGRNQLAFLDLRNNTALELLYCWDNDIEWLDLSMLHNLRMLECVMYVDILGELKIYYDTKLPLEVLKIYKHNIISDKDISVTEEVYGDVLEYVE